MRHVLLVTLLISSSLFSQTDQVEKISLVGLKKNKSSFLRKFIALKEGGALDSLVLQKDINQLRRLESISDADYSVSKVGAGSYAVSYTIVENFTLIPAANIWTSNNGEFAFRIGLYEYNLLGQGVTFGGFYQRDVLDSYGVNLKAPFLFGKQWGIAINFQDLTTAEPVFFETGSTVYDYRNKSIEGLALFRASNKSRFELGGNLFSENYTYRSGLIAPEVPNGLAVSKFAIKFLYEYNDLKYELYKLSGFRSLLKVQSVHSKNDDLPNFLIGWNDLMYFKRIGANGNWANRLRVGVSTNNSTPFAPFALDNNINIRGVGNTIDRGTASIVLNSEYRYTFFEKGWFVIQGNAFTDIGSWRHPGKPFDDLIQEENIIAFSGLGFRLMHQRIFNAILRFDYGVELSKNGGRGFVIGIGQYF